MALQGIRLSDLYESKGYNDWMKDSTNSKLVESAIQQSPDSDPNKVRGHLYLNSRIKSAIGEEEFAKLPHMNLEEKFNWFNNNVAQQDEPEELEEPEIQQPMLEQRDSTNPIMQAPPPEEHITDDMTAFEVPPEGRTLRDWFRDNAGGDYNAFLQSRREQREAQQKKDFPNIDLTGVWGAGFKSGETKQLEDELSVLKETNPGNSFAIQLKENQLKVSREKDYNQTKNALNDLYKEEELRESITDGRTGYFAPIERRNWESKSTQNTIDELTGNLRKRFDSDSSFAFDSFKTFEDEMMKYVPQYRNYHDSYALPFSPDEMKDIMAEYYAIRQLKDPNEATEFATAVFKNRLAEKQTLHDKAAIAIKQDGANIAGNIISTVGMIANSAEGAWRASREEFDIDDTGWWKEFLYYSANNPITKWGNRMTTTGTWDPHLQEVFEENQYNALQLHRAAGNETKFRDINTPFEIFAQSGFTIAGMATGTATAQILANSVGKTAASVATRMLMKEGASKLSRVTAKGINVLGKELVTVGAAYLPAAAEASMDGLETYQTAKDNAAEAVLSGMQEQLAREYEDGTYDMWYQQNTRIPYQLDAEKQMTEAQKKELAQLRAQERAYLWDTYQTLRQQEVLSDPEVANTIEMGARRAAAKNMFDETTWIALGDYTISNTLGLGFKAAKKAARRALLGENINAKFKWVPEGNHYRPVVKETTFKDKLGAFSRGIVEAGEEGVEELFQTVDTKIREDLNKNMIAQYIENRYDPEGAATVTDRLFKNFAVTKASFNENILSDEALYSFALGAMSAGIGSPTVFRGARTFVDSRKKGASFGQALWEGTKASWRNPIVENFQELKTKKIEDQNEADDLNRWISAHPEIDTLNDEAAIIGFIDQQAKALRDGDEATYRDALMGQQVATMLMYERVNPSGSKANFYARIEQLAKLSPTDAQARDVVNQALNVRGDTDTVRTTEGPLNEQETAIVQEVKEKAQKLLELQDRLKKEISVIDSQFGSAVSRETKEALAYSLIMQKDWEDRISSITKKATEAFNEANPDTPVTPISREEAPSLNALARYGSKDAIDAEYKALMQQRAALRARKKGMYRYEYKAAFDKNQKAIRENRDAAKAFAKLEEGRVITAEEILSLGSKERAYLLDESMRKNYSEEQQNEINKFLSAEGIRGDMVTDLIDAGRLQAKREYFKQEYDALTNQGGVLIPLFDQEVRKKAAKTWTRKKLETAMEATTYDQFRDAMDKALQTGEFTDSDRMVMSEIFNAEDTGKQTHDFYEQYKKEEMSRRATRSIIENSPEFQNLSDDQKELVRQAAEQVQRDGAEVSTESVVAKLSDPEYRAQLERQGVDVTALTSAKTFEELAEAVNKAMEQKKRYDENARALKEKAAKEKQEQDPSATPKPQGKTPKTTIVKEKYEANRGKVDSIFKKIANNFTRRKKQNLSQDEYVTFIGLYTDKQITGPVLVEDLDTRLTLDALIDNVHRLKEAVSNKLYTDESAKDSEEVENSLKLVASMEGISGALASLRKIGLDASLNTFLKNSILEIRPDLAPDFKVVNVTLPKKFTRLDGKAEKALGTETEKKWYADHKIAENLKTLMGIKASKVDYVFIKDSELARQLSEELGDELNDDNLPIIIAARVPLKTPGAIQGKDGYNYLYVGLLTDSRTVPVAEERNELNSLRYLAMEQEDDGPIVYNGTVVKASAAVPKMPVSSTDKTETTSLRDWLFDRHKDIRKEEDRKKAIVKDFKDHYRRIKTTVKNGEVRGSFEWNGKIINISWATAAPDSDTEITRSAYIQENQDGTVTPLFIEVRRIDEVDFDDTHTMYEALNDSDIDITSREYASNDGNYIRKSVVALSNLILANRESLLSRKARAKALPKLNGDSSVVGAIQKSIAKYLNLSKTSAEQKGKISIGVQVEGEELQLICWETGTEGDKEPIYGIPLVLSRMPLSTLSGDNPGETQEALTAFAKEAIKNLIYDEDGNLRTADTRDDGNQWPVVKFEDNYRKNDKDVTAVYDERDIELKLLGNIWQVRKYAIKQDPEAISVERVTTTGPSGPTAPSANAQAEAIKKITAPEFIDEHEGEHFELAPGETEVTTFIRGGEDDVDWGDTSLAGQFATNLGTSIDKLYRVWRQLPAEVKAGKDAYKAIFEYMDSRGAFSWPGLSKTEGIPRMIEQFRRIDKFFEERGEVQVNADLIFRTTVEYSGKYKYLVGKPDIITVDKDGIYHIYDMKSFRYQNGAVAKVPGFKSMFFIINGKRNIEKDMDKWRKQLSLYRAMIESKLGAGTVSTELGIIPIRLGYTPDGTIDPYVVSGVGAHKLQDRLGKALHLSFRNAPMETSPSGSQEPITRCYDEPIRLEAILKLDDINPEGWKQMDKTETMRADFERAKAGLGQQAPITPQAPSGEEILLGEPEIKGPVTMYKPLEEMGEDDLGAELKTLIGDLDESLIEQYANQGACNNPTLNPGK